MKQHYAKIILFCLCCLVGAKASAHDFEVDGIFYNLNTDGTSVSVTFNETSYVYTGEVTIPETVTYNGKTYSVTNIGEKAFDGCSDLTSVTISNSVTTISSEAFEDCSGLTTVTIPNSVTTIGDEAFQRCTGLTSITFGNKVTIIGKNAFEGCSSLTSVTFPESLTTIGDEAFERCRNLASITIGNNITNLIADAFDKTAWFENQEDGMIYLGLYAYRYKGQMPENTSITLKEGTKIICGKAFWNSEGLTSIAIPNSVTAIVDYAFGECNNIGRVICQIEKVFPVDASIFTEAVYSNAKLIVPKGTKEKYLATSAWNLFQKIEESDFGELNGIESVLAGQKVENVYRFDGKAAGKRFKGLNILHLSDGSVRKVMVK